MLGVSPSRPERPRRVASTGWRPSPRPVFGGGENPSVCVAHCGPRLLAPSPGRNHAGQESVSVTPACRACRSLGRVLPVAGNEGAACAHARVPRDPDFPRSPGGAYAPRSGRGAEREERGWVAVGSRAPPVRRRCPPRAVPPALPRLCRSRGPRPRRARRVRASLLLRAVWRSPRSPSPAAFPRLGSSG